MSNRAKTERRRVALAVSGEHVWNISYLSDQDILRKRIAQVWRCETCGAEVAKNSDRDGYPTTSQMERLGVNPDCRVQTAKVVMST